MSVNANHKIKSLSCGVFLEILNSELLGAKKKKKEKTLAGFAILLFKVFHTHTMRL